MSVTIVAMVNHTTSSSDHGDSCPVDIGNGSSSAPEVVSFVHFILSYKYF